ncbi:MAG: tRNA adenosine(34) deaminase TadA [Methylococcaceae bacterium]|nr:tRNA adenosine(34) deaminase TadA [Methylococcaceae bacterium]
MNIPDEQWMEHAIRLARKAESLGEVPVGAVLIRDHGLIAEGWNCPIRNNDPSAHAEIVAIRAAGDLLGNYRLVDTTLYVTLEPCMMCIGAIMHARVGRLVFGAPDPIRGSVCSVLNLSDLSFFNHRLEWQSGVLADRCSDLLKDFFMRKRNIIAKQSD